MSDLHDASRFLLLEEVAAELRVTPEVLKRRSRAGKFPKLLEVTPYHYRMLRSDYEDWMEGAWTSNARVVAAIAREVVINRRSPRAMAATVARNERKRRCGS
ncbi:MAG: hypothetical protein KDE27_01860 [Planctomycetes bacterium]|nr:hypothetical protein [Planctomycetota bacterium]